MAESQETGQLSFIDRTEWRKWLSENHDKVEKIFLVYYKKTSGKPSVSYNEAVEEALCFGWIDSKVKSIDEERYMQQFSPRRKKRRDHYLTRHEKQNTVG